MNPNTMKHWDSHLFDLPRAGGGRRMPSGGRTHWLLYLEHHE